MPDWLVTHGHLGWTLFAVLLYSGLAVLAVDYVWRRVTMSTRRLLAASAALWAIGFGLLLALY